MTIMKISPILSLHTQFHRNRYRLLRSADIFKHPLLTKSPNQEKGTVFLTWNSEVPICTGRWAHQKLWGGLTKHIRGQLGAGLDLLPMTYYLELTANSDFGVLTGGGRAVFCFF